MTALRWRTPGPVSKLGVSVLPVVGIPRMVWSVIVVAPLCFAIEAEPRWSPRFVSRIVRRQEHSTPGSGGVRPTGTQLAWEMDHTGQG